MSWINFFEEKIEKKYIFGRGTNANLSKQEEELFNNSSNAFENKNIIDAYEYFLNSLQNYTDNDPNKNILISKEDNQLTFTLYQGGAKITGKITEKNFYAEVILVKKSDANVALKRYVLERNYQLTYAYYFSDEEFIKLKLFHDNSTMSPQKIFFPIRELALNADFDKEHIRSEFNNIQLQDINHLNKMDSDELRIKYTALQKWIVDLDSKVSTLPSNDNAGMQAFLYLNLLLKIDYLLVPKYIIGQKLSKKIQAYFNEENSSVEAKNEELKHFVNKLKILTFEEFSQNFYIAKYTFNPIEKTSIEEINNFINESLSKIRWYKNNRYNQIIHTIYRYIAFYILYSYGVNRVIRALLHLLIEIQNSLFFHTIGYKNLYNVENQTFSKRQIISKINTIIDENKERYVELNTFSNELNFGTFNEFSNSFYIQIQQLNFEEI